MTFEIHCRLTGNPNATASIDLTFPARSRNEAWEHAISLMVFTGEWNCLLVKPKRHVEQRQYTRHRDGRMEWTKTRRDIGDAVLTAVRDARK